MTAAQLPRPSGGLTNLAPGAPGQPVMRWASRTHSIAGVEMELARIWSSISLTTTGEEGEEERRVSARSSVMNLVVIAGRGEVGERAAAIIEALTGRHPSRTIIVTPADPDGPPWLDAQVQAHCVLPSADAAETCAELVYLTCGGQTGQHLSGVVAPLLIHDLPVTVWWPSEPHFESPTTRDLLSMADRVIVDGSSWSDDGLRRLAAMAALPARYHVDVSDFALIRQSRWREAIASSFDRPALMPFVGSIRSITVRYADRDGTPGAANVVKPLYHVAWLAARLDMAVERPVVQSSAPWGGYDAVLRESRHRITVALRPQESSAVRGTTLAVELAAERRGAALSVEVTGQEDGVTVRATAGGTSLPERHFLAPRRREGDLLAETIESVGRDPIGVEALRMAEVLVDGHG